MKKQTINSIVVVLVVILIIIIGMRMLKKPMAENTAKTDTASSINQETVSSDTSTASNVKTFTITGSNYAFAPNVITVNKGDTVKIIMQNSGGMHDLKIDEFNVATPRITGGQDASVEFVADKTGSFQYYCSVGSHRAMGMWGTLMVK